MIKYGSRSGISPTKGPGMNATLSYYCQNTDARYLPGVLHSVNDIAASATKHSIITLFKGSRMFCCTKMNHLEICTIAIRTSNYSVMSHIDKSDKLTKASETELSNRWKQMLDGGTLHSTEERSLQCQYTFSLEFGTGVHANCGYQCPTNSGNMNENSTIPFNLFVSPTLVISKRMHNFVSYTWMAHVAHHTTAVLMFLECDYHSFGRHPDVSVEAWGESKI